MSTTAFDFILKNPGTKQKAKKVEASWADDPDRVNEIANNLRWGFTSKSEPAPTVATTHEVKTYPPGTFLAVRGPSLKACYVKFNEIPKEATECWHGVASAIWRPIPEHWYT